MFDEVQSVIGPYGDPPVACRQFDPKATEIARQVAGLISRHLPSVRPEHVGSTAVAGCGGRGIIDLLIACDEADMEKVELLLCKLGFQQRAEALFPSHRPAFKGVLHDKGEAFALHVHVLPSAAQEVDSMRFLRSCLRADMELSRAYVQHKQAIIASGVTDEGEYCRQKSAFLKMVLG